MTKTKKLDIEKQGIEDAFQTLDAKTEKDTRLSDRLTRLLFK